MKKQVLLITIILSSTISFAQSGNQQETEKWIKKEDIELNNPVPPIGFSLEYDCKGYPIYRKDIADTIIIFCYNGAIAEDLKTFQKTVKETGFNSFRYPTKVQSNGTVIVNKISKNVFVWRKDTLFLLDEYNDAFAKEQLKLMDKFLSKKITRQEYEKSIENLDESNYPFAPQFKIIYFKGIFDNEDYYRFTTDQNFRNEGVQLVSKWTENGKIYYEINLKTYTNGRYRFSEDMRILERNNCRKK